MSHCITALIGTAFSLERFVSKLGKPAPVPAPFNLQILPLGAKRLDLLSGSANTPAYNGFIYLSRQLERGIGDLIANGKIAYIETEYFGGIGEQAAAVFDSGKIVWKGADSSTGEMLISPISQALSMLGVQSTADRDEFDAIGLSRFRSLESLGLYD